MQYPNILNMYVYYAKTNCEKTLRNFAFVPVCNPDTHKLYILR